MCASLGGSDGSQANVFVISSRHWETHDDLLVIRCSQWLPREPHGVAMRHNADIHVLTYGFTLEVT